MKSKYLICFFLLNQLLVHAQTYVPFPDSNATWCAYRYFQIINGNDELHTYNYQQYLRGDTLVNGTTYHRVFENGSYSCMYIFLGTSCGSWNYTNAYVGGIREDLNKKIFFIAADSLTEMLLYDFNLNVYDTMPYTYNQAWYNNNIPLTVTSIDSVYDGTLFRKRYNISRDTTMSWEYEYVHIIEGIGSTHGLIWDINPYFEQGGDLVAATQYGLGIYPNPPQACVISSLQEINEIATTISVYPNPAKDEISITGYSFPENKKTEVKVFDVFGKEIFSTRIATSNHKLQTSNLSQGVYFVHVGALRAKFVKQ